MNRRPLSNDRCSCPQSDSRASHELNFRKPSGTGVSPVRIETHGRDARATNCGAGKSKTMRAFNCVPCSLFLLFSILIFSTGCRTAAPLPKADLSAPGWKTFQGQAIWRAKKDAPEIVGEILLATNTNGRAFVQFTKTPFPFVIAQTTTNAWQIESPTQNRSYSGHGSPPDRVIWFQLPRALANQPLPKRWRWKNDGANWQLENPSSGERLNGYFNE